MKSKFLEAFMRGEVPDNRNGVPINIGFWRAEGTDIPVDPEWHKQNTNLLKSVINYLNDWDATVQYKGPSICIICGMENRSDEHTKDGFVYPSGYIHYLSNHNVAPDSRIVDAAKEAGY